MEMHGFSEINSLRPPPPPPNFQTNPSRCAKSTQITRNNPTTNDPAHPRTMKGKPMESILSLYRDRPNPQDYPASYPKLWVDNKTGDIKMAESSDQGDSV